MESLATTACFRDDLLDLPSDFSDADDDKNDVVLSPLRKRSRAFSLLPCPSPAFPGFVEEEELEWISNKDAFPMVESFVDIMPNHPSISSTTTGHNHSHLSPVSVLENSSTTTCSINSLISSSSNNDNNKKNVNCKTSNVGGGSGAIAAMISLTSIFKVPGKARSKQLRKRRREMSGQHFQRWEKVKPSSSRVGLKQASIGRKCLHCGSEKTPQWRAGPLGPKTLCNACGVRYKSGRLVPEYRPASSPTFSSELHSNSHRKIVEMRKQKMPVDSELELKPVLIS